jgi:hypothetical protein
MNHELLAVLRGQELTSGCHFPGATEIEHASGCFKAFGLDVGGEMVEVEVFTCIVGRVCSEPGEIL